MDDDDDEDDDQSDERESERATSLFRSPAALLDDEPAGGEFGAKFLGHGAVDDEAEAGVDADEKLRAVVRHEEPERKEAAVVLSAEGVVPPGKTLLHVQYESAWGAWFIFTIGVPHWSLASSFQIRRMRV